MNDTTAQIARISAAASDLDDHLDRLFVSAADLRAILKRISSQNTKAAGND